MKSSLITILLMVSAAAFCLTVAASAAQKPLNKGAVTIYVAYTCNTWGQMQPCPS